MKFAGQIILFFQRKHRNELYINISVNNESKKQQNSSQFVSKNCAKYGANDPKQKEVTDAFVHAIAGTLSPLSLVENPFFKNVVA